MLEKFREQKIQALPKSTAKCISKSSPLKIQSFAWSCILIVNPAGVKAFGIWKQQRRRRSLSNRLFYHQMLTVSDGGGTGSRRNLRKEDEEEEEFLWRCLPITRSKVEAEAVWRPFLLLAVQMYPPSSASLTTFFKSKVPLPLKTLRRSSLPSLFNSTPSFSQVTPSKG